MPVPAILGCELGHDHEVANPRADVLVAAGTEIGLAGLVGLDALHRERSVQVWVVHPNSAHKRRSTQASTATATIT